MIEKAKLSKPRRDLLAALSTYGGWLKERQLTPPDKRLATRMQADGLVLWVSHEDERFLEITTAGADAI